VANAKRVQKEIRKEAAPVVVGEFKFPEYLRCTKADTEKSREAKRKKVKALKFTHKTAVQEQDHRQRQNEWLNF